MKDKESNPYALIFPRGEHPDERTNAEYLRDVKLKKVEKKLESGEWYPLKRCVGRAGNAIKCITTGKEYKSMRDAAKDLNLNNGNISNHLRGHKCYSHVGGYKFERV